MELVVNNSYTSVLSDDGAAIKAVNDCLKYEIDAKKFIQKHKKYKKWDCVCSFFDHKQSRFLSGLTRMVSNNLTDLGLNHTITDLRKPPVNVFQPYELKDTTLYDFQEKAVEVFLKQGRGVLQLPTGAGKTLIAKAIFQSLSVPTLFLTHRTTLMYQTAERFANRLPDMYKNKIGIIGDSEYSPNFLTFGTVQTLYSMLKRYGDTAREELAQFQCVIIDEAHRIKAKSFNEIVSACDNAYYRCALTATPFMRDQIEENLLLMGTVGPVIFKVPVSSLINRGLLAQPYFRFVKYTTKDILSKEGYDVAYVNGIVHNEDRNNAILKTVQNLLPVKNKLLIIVNEIAHGENLLALFKKANLKVAFCHGKMKHIERAQHLKALDGGKINCLIASTIFDEGIDIQDIGGIVLAGAGKSVPMLYQRIGRSMRRKDEENYCVIVDFEDSHNSYLYNQYLIRRSLVEAQEGFKIIE